MVIDQLAVPGLSIMGGAIVAAQDVPGIDALAEKAGLGAIAVILLWWMLGRFSKQLDKLTVAIERLIEVHEKKE